jgi:pteridine reductase
LASKAALRALTKVLARELGPKVRVNGVSPGAITFPAGTSAARKKRVIEKGLLRKAGRPEDVVEAVLYLSRAQFVTGHVLEVDGGRFV